MDLKFIDINHDQGISYLKLIDDDDRYLHTVKLSPDQLFLLMVRIAHILWTNYDLVHRP